jgi:hypothetical protein
MFNNLDELVFTACAAQHCPFQTNDRTNAGSRDGQTAAIQFLSKIAKLPVIVQTRHIFDV